MMQKNKIEWLMKGFRVVFKTWHITLQAIATFASDSRFPSGCREIDNSRLQD
ncbi:hypothetical protein [Legionella nagasakiensis]|uniref:hypothetical protein n=1 Tax=Legionella nagasakiensis TaxID=535290 RepID=UPI0013EFBDE0|nr:hypothetical protein [Legionella nagasakiensis]